MPNSQFTLHFGPVDQNNRCSVFLETFVGGAHGEFRIPFTPNDWTYIQDGWNYLVDIDPHGPDALHPRAVGIDLFKALFRDSIRDLYLQCVMLITEDSPLHIKLKFNLRDHRSQVLYNLPWECLYDPDQQIYIDLRKDCYVSRELVTGNAAQHRPTRGEKLRILLAVAQPSQYGAVLPEANNTDGLEQASNSLVPYLGEEICQQTSRFEVHTVFDASSMKLKTALKNEPRGFHFIHFLCHGRYRDGEGSLILQKENGEPDEILGVDLANILDQHLHHPEVLQLIYLNACQGAVQTTTNAHGLFFNGVAPALLNKGVANVVAMSHLVHVQAAQNFAQAFYRGLAGERSIEAAVHSARSELYETDPRNLSWVKPVWFSQASTKPFPDMNWPLFHKLWTLVGCLLFYLTFNLIGQAQQWDLSLLGVAKTGDSVHIYGLLACTPLFLLFCGLTRYHTKQVGHQLWYLRLPPFGGAVLNSSHPFTRRFQMGMFVIFLVVPLYGQFFFLAGLFKTQAHFVIDNKEVPYDERKITIVSEWWHHYLPSQELQKVNRKKKKGHFIFGDGAIEYHPIFFGWIFTSLWLMGLLIWFLTVAAIFRWRYK